MMDGQNNKDSSWLPTPSIGLDMASVTPSRPRSIKRICCLGAGYVVGAVSIGVLPNNRADTLIRAGRRAL